MRSRRAIFAGAIAVAFAAALLLLAWRRRPKMTPPAPGAHGPAAPVRAAWRLDRAPPTVPAAPARRPKTELAPPPGYATAASPAAGAPPVALAPGELPMTPPAFARADDREAFHAWWVKELTRRIDIFERLEPDHPYPTGEDAAHLVAAYYDAAEARGPGESAEQASRRADALVERFQDFVAAFGVPPQTLATRAGDPQYGAPLPPPGGVTAAAGRAVEWPDRVPLSAMPQPR